MKKDINVVDIKANENAVVAAPANSVMMDEFFNGNIMVDMDLGSFYSISPTTKEGKIALYNAINNPDKRLSDHINMVLSIKDVLVEIVELEQESTGEMVKCPRIILIDDKGVSYQCVSVGIFSGMKRVFKLFGMPTWEEPVKLKVLQITKAEKKMLSIAVVM